MNSYNGFSGSQRLKALKWFREQQAKGFRPLKPNSCDICTQTQGVLEYHSEDYSSPFGDNIGQFGLCYMCHMMIHCRYKNEHVWNIYKKSLYEKKVYRPFYSRNWNVFKRDCLNGALMNLGFEIVKENNYETLLKIEKGHYIPKQIVEEKELKQSELFSD